MIQLKTKTEYKKKQKKNQNIKDSNKLNEKDEIC